MKHGLTLALAAAVIALSTPSLLAQNGATAGFDKLKSLAGEWHGKAPDGKNVTVSYQVVSGGSSLLETITPEKEPNMVTLYHPDGEALMLTHYCALANQPRMRAAVPKGEIKKLEFAYVDASNLASPEATHMHNLAITFKDANHITQVWTLHNAGKETPMTFELERKM